MKEKNQYTQAENFQLWAELYRKNSITYSIEVSSSDTYFADYVNYPSINYWEWFVIPNELIFIHTSKILFKPRVLKTHTLKKQPLLICKKTIVPLRI